VSWSSQREIASIVLGQPRVTTRTCTASSALPTELSKPRPTRVDATRRPRGRATTRPIIKFLARRPSSQGSCCDSSSLAPRMQLGAEPSHASRSDGRQGERP
jgi:hypothetical protein